MLRHAEAANKNKNIPEDHDRPLTKNGAESCLAIRKFLVENNEIPERVISSTARRTRETFERVFGGLDVAAKFDLRLYLGGVAEIFSIIHEAGPETGSLMIIGHNPGLHEFCVNFSRASGKENAVIRKLRNNYPPCAMAVFSIERDWKNLQPGMGEIVSFVVPGDL